MRRPVVALVLFGLMTGSVSRAASALPQAAAAQGAPAQLSAADAAPFLGDWALSGSGQNGPITFNLTLKMDGAKPVGEIGSDVMASTTVTDISKNEKSLVLRYSFDYQGNQVPTTVTLTPAADGKVTGSIDFASGAYVMDVTGAKKPAK